MKMFTNLPGNLRALFGALRIVSVLFGFFWLLILLVGSWVPKQFSDEPRLMVTVGDLLLRVDPAAVALKSDTAKAGSLGLSFMRGSLQMDLCSQDARLVSALRQTVLPSVAVLVAFSWILFGALRQVCANLERGEAFSEKNLRLVRSIGLTLIAYSLTSAGAGIWGAHVMGDYLAQHVNLTGLPTPVGALGFLVPAGWVTLSGGLVIGCLVLAVSEAFRQGLALKTESELTI